jgi:septal ring factor EnvC (AmiA/AmiB activator)
VEATVTAILAFFFKYLWVPLLGLIGWLWRENREEAKTNCRRLNSVEGRLLTVENKYTTKEDVKQIVREVSQDWKEDVMGMKNTLSSMQTILQDLRTDIAVSKAISNVLEHKHHIKPYRED